MDDIKKCIDLLLQHSPIVYLCEYGDDGDGRGQDWCRPANMSWWLNLNNQIPLDRGEYPFELYSAVVRFKEEDRERVLTPEPIKSFDPLNAKKTVSLTMQMRERSLMKGAP